MKAAVYEQYGPPEVFKITEVEQPTPKDDEVLIKVHAASVTTGDVNMRGFVFVPPSFKPMTRLAFGLNKPRSPILGVEVAGEIVAVGEDVTQFKPGDPVFGIDGARRGTYAEYKCMPEKAGLTHKPANLSYEEAAVIPNGALTALTFLRMGKMQRGEHILINGASGSVGTAAVQLAKYFGAEVTGVCSTTNLALVQSLGADHVIDYTQEDFTQRHAAYDLIFDTVGKTTFGQCKAALKPNGRYLASAGGLGSMGQMLWTSIIGGKKVFAGASSESKDDLVDIKGIVEAGHLKPVIDRRYSLDNIVEAHRYVDTGRKKGNVVVTVV
ncbi:MAG: NAD(P)-dependent alcohol dehydrogenase [Chloroflexi bacterium]|nr:NAD(P)-dependent alcohol dehydrogenase [Chloroflexota bacterium]